MTISPDGPDDEDHTAMMVEAEYLRSQGLIECTIGGDGWIVAKLTVQGRDAHEEAAKTVGKEPSSSIPVRTAVVVTALGLEYAAVRAFLVDLEEVEHPAGTLYEKGVLISDGGNWTIYIVEAGAGNPNAAIETERVIATARPEVALFVGVAGGVKDVVLGDVVVATKVYGYHSGKETAEGFAPRPDLGLVTYRLEQRARAESRRSDWKAWATKVGVRDVETVSVLLGPIAAGERVVASERSATFALLRSTYSDVLAVEMEGRGFLAAARANETRALVVRGVSDLIEHKDEADRTGWQPRAARNAAAFALHLLTKLKPTAEGRPSDERASASASQETERASLLEAQIELQKQSLAHQREAQHAQLREQNQSKFTEMYVRFLQEAKAYARAIGEYWEWMHKTAFRADRATRADAQRSVKDSRDALDRALQPILLADADETRGSIRWELLRKRGLEPVVDTTENQRAYAAVIHYHRLRLLDGINRLQENVREALGFPAPPRSDDATDFDEEMLAEAKATADKIQADINRQFEGMMRERRQASAERQAPLRVGDETSDSPRSPSALPESGTGIRIHVWNVLHVEIFEDDQDDLHPGRCGELTLVFLREIWAEVLAKPIDEVPNDFVAAWAKFREIFMTCPSTVFYRIVEHAGGSPDIRKELDKALERCKAPVRFEGEKLVPVVGTGLAGPERSASALAPLTQGAGSPPAVEQRTALFDSVDNEIQCRLSKAAALVGAPEPSERLVVFAPQGTFYGGMSLSLEQLLDAVKACEAERPGFPLLPLGGEQEDKADGILRASDDGRFAVGRDGSIALRRRLQHDRRGAGHVVARGDVGLYTSIEYLLSAILYIRRFVHHSPKQIRQWSFRHELHGIKGRHLMDDPPQERRSGGEWQRSKPCAEASIALAGFLDLDAPTNEVGGLLDMAATKIAASFGLHEVVRRMRVGRSTVLAI